MAGKRRKNRRKQSGAEKAAPEKRIGNKDGNQSDDGQDSKLDQASGAGSGEGGPALIFGPKFPSRRLRAGRIQTIYEAAGLPSPTTKGVE